MTGPAEIHTRKGVYVTENATLERGIVTFTHGRLRVDGRLYPEKPPRSYRLAPGEYVEWRPEVVTV